MPFATKKYKLFSAGTDGSGGNNNKQPPPCAFFASPAGCRNGDGCKFAHESTNQVSTNNNTNNTNNNRAPSNRSNASSSINDNRVRTESIVSSESEDNDADSYNNNNTHRPDNVGSTPDQVQSSPFTKSTDALPTRTITAFKTIVEESTTSMNTNSNNKKKRGSKNDPFANPKKKQIKFDPSLSDKQNSTTNSTTPPKVNNTTNTNSNKSSSNIQPTHSTQLNNNNTNPNTTNNNTKKLKQPKQTNNNMNKNNNQKIDTAKKAVPDFRSLALPIAAFSMEPTDTQNANQNADTDKKPMIAVSNESIQKPKVQYPLPNSTEFGRKWLNIVELTQNHPKFETNYDLMKYKETDLEAGYASNAWVSTSKFVPTKHMNNPQVIAIDCEMCETQDPVSQSKDPRALCRISVVDVETDEVLLDTLVKPMWPVLDYRTWVNGISAEHLENVQFTLRHAQAFMMALCSQETVILGHAVHNDLAALRIEHYCVGDSALLYKAADSDTATVSLRDLAAHLFKSEMPKKHDSVNDARVACQCIEHYRTNNGNVDRIPRSINGNNNGTGKSRTDYACELFIHRIPKDACNEDQLAKMFLSHTDIQPIRVDDIEFNESKAGNNGKTIVYFASDRHAKLAFDTLDGKAFADMSGRLQKRVFFRNGDYCHVRKMVYELKQLSNDEGKKDDQNNSNNIVKNSNRPSGQNRNNNYNRRQSN